VVPVRNVVLRGDVRSYSADNTPATGALLRARGTTPQADHQVQTIRLLVIGEPGAASSFISEYNADGGHGRMRLAASLSPAELEGFDACVAACRPERVVLLQSSWSDDRFQRVLDSCVRHGLPLQVLETDSDDEPVAVIPGSGRVAYAVHPSAVHSRAYMLKRVGDVTVAAALLVALSPFFAAVALASRLSSPGPVFYVSWRVGVCEEPFPCHKFRTMHVGADVQQEELESRNEADGCLFKIRDDPRVTRMGRFLRRTSLDELPQLVNVLRGEMSLVGPRPLPLRDVALMEPEFRSRHAVLPGLTGLWQVSGRSAVTARRMMELDLEYIRTWSLGLDLRVLLRTVGVVIKGKGAY
jgi:lipopolysaccharide/colanic/teichoic acid biosynthesis glycosyltransferase